MYGDIDRIFHENRNNVCDPGLDNELTDALQAVFDSNPAVVLQAFPVMLEKYGGYSCIDTAMAWLGRQDSEHNSVRRIMIGALLHESPFVRDAAAEILREIGDASAIEPLQNAISREKEPAFKQDLANALEDMRSRLNEENDRVCV